MKAIISLFFVALFFCSCKNWGTKIKTHRFDTLPLARYWVLKAGGGAVGPYVDSALYQIDGRFVFTDTAKGIMKGWIFDTIRFGRAIDDTLRDVARHPIFDTAHKPLWHSGFYRVVDSSFTPIPKMH